MNKTDLSPELQEALEREAKEARKGQFINISTCLPCHKRMIDWFDKTFEQGALSDTAKRIHQEGMISVGQAKNLISLAWATASAYGDKTDEADCQDWIKHNL